MKLAIAIPHAAHRPERRETLKRLLACLGKDFDGAVFQEREPHWIWSRKLWGWGLDSGADFLVQLQDDVIVPDNFIMAVQALLTAHPREVTALFGVHPLGREIARQGGRMYRTRAWLMGNAYALSRSFLGGFLPWVDANPKVARETCEDALINRYVMETGRDVFHPVPSLAEHDLGVPSTWAQNASAQWQLDNPDNHGHRKATVSYRDFLPKEIERPDFWAHSGAVRLLPGDLTPMCWFCLQEPAFISSAETGVHLGSGCFAKMANEAARRMLR